MLTNNEIKLINSLQRKKERQNNGLFIVEGIKMVEELTQSNFTVRKVFSTVEMEGFKQLSLITENQLSKISQFSTPNQVLAIVEIPSKPVIDYNQSSLILEDINNPGNLGTIIRTADWFGINQIICSNGSTDCYSPKVVSSTMGSIFRSKIHYTNLEEFLSVSKLTSYGAFLKGKFLSEINLSKNCNIILGSESHGISSGLEKIIDQKITIEGITEAESLNLSIAAGIFCNHYFQSNR
jgi:TrmH family RNA methyltransferase